MLHLLPGGFVNLLQPSPLVASLDRTAGRGAGDGLRGLREGLTPAADLRGVTVPDRPSLRRAHRESGPEPVVHAGRPPELGRRALPEPAGRGRETTGCSRRGAGREASLQCSAWAGRGGLTEGGGVAFVAWRFRQPSPTISIGCQPGPNCRPRGGRRATRAAGGTDTGRRFTRGDGT